MEKARCSITGKEFPVTDLTPAGNVRKSLSDFIRREYPGLKDNDLISDEALDVYRRKYLEDMVQDETGKLNEMEKEVVQAIADEDIIADHLAGDEKETLNFGQRLADKVATFGGSWTFIISFAVILFLWIGLNSVMLMAKAFDPYPYILLNLILSCLAALQAPVIMMSQNRQEAKDRQRSEYDYKVNLKAELEIRMLHEKLDHLMMNQTQKLLEFQQMQIDLLEEIASKNGHNRLD